MSSVRALANQEREAQTKRLSQLAKALLLSAATIMTFAMVALLVADKMYRPDAFVIDQIKITGKFKYISAKDIQQAVFEEPLGNFFSIELDEIKDRVQSMAWVQSVDVRRSWPHTLELRVEEHRPVMRWKSIGKQSKGRAKGQGEQWVSLGGKIVSLDKPLGRYSSVTLSGAERDARQLLTHAITWQQQLAPSGLRLLHVSLTQSQSWRLQLSHSDPDKSFELMLGRDNVEDRLARFQTLFDTQFKHSRQRLVRIDARYPDGLAVEAKQALLQGESLGVNVDEFNNGGASDVNTKREILSINPTIRPSLLSNDITEFSQSARANET